jgi:hypothetical protein
MIEYRAFKENKGSTFYGRPTASNFEREKRNIPAVNAYNVPSPLGKDAKKFSIAPKLEYRGIQVTDF